MHATETHFVYITVLFEVSCILLAEKNGWNAAQKLKVGKGIFCFQRLQFRLNDFIKISINLVQQLPEYNCGIVLVDGTDNET